MKRNLFFAVSVVALAFALASPAYGQAALAKGIPSNSLIEAGASGELVKAADSSYLGVLTPETGTVTATGNGTTAGAATLNKTTGTVTTEALTTAGLAKYTLTLTNPRITATTKIHVSIANGTNAQGTVAQGLVTPGAGSATIEALNLHATQALNGTLKFSYGLEN